MSADLELLTERYLAGTATESECARLERLLAQDPSVLARFLADLDQDVALRKLWALQRETAGDRPDPDAPVRAPDRNRWYRARSGRGPEPLPFQTAAFAAAVALLVMALFWSSLQSGLPLPAKEGTGRASQGSTKSGPELASPGRVERREREAGLSSGAAPTAGRPRAPECAERDRTANLPRAGTNRAPIPSAPRTPAVLPEPVRGPGGPTTLPSPPHSPGGATVAGLPAASPVLVLEVVRGTALVRSEAGDIRAEVGTVVRSGQGLETTDPDARLVARYDDGTRLELGPRTALREILDRETPAPGARGKRFFLAQGSVTAEVAKQPADQPLLVSTPQAQAKIIGTILRLTVEGDDRGQTRLFVREGRVRLTRQDGRSVEVTAGYEAVARSGMELVARPRDASLAVSRAGPALWLRADQGVVLNGPAVSAWADRSGNARHAIQPVPACQPILVRNAIGGHPAVRFDGVDDFLSFSCPVTGLSGITLFLVSATLEDRGCGVNGSGNAAVFWHETEDCATVLLTPSESKVRFYFGTGQTQPIFTWTRANPIGRGFSVSTALKAGAEAVLFVNGRESFRAGNQRPAVGSCEKVGQLGRGEGDLLTNRQFPGQYEGWTYFSGEIAELVVYARSVTEEERRSIEEYLLEKYSLN